MINGDYISIEDIIKATGSTEYDLHHHDLTEEISAVDIAYNDVGLTLAGVVKIVCKSPRYAFAQALSIYTEPLMNYRASTGGIVSLCVNTVLPTIQPINDTTRNDVPVIGHGSVIGGAGFGYERGENGELIRIKHLGRVVIGHKVQIHNNVCIDRGVIGDTVIGDGVKIDNLVHIAHNVKIGKNTLIVAGAVIGGSVEIGENCFIGMNASIKQKVKIGNNVTVGAGAIVLKDVPDDVTVIGNPAYALQKPLTIIGKEG